MSKCSYCDDEDHDVQACPYVDKAPWLKDPDERWHTKIVTEDDGAGTTWDTEVSCNCQLFDEGETHYDFDGM